ncbi:hypothetical protein HDU85_001111 [Gaertneriomyces sp. JEL0708]|nr:hypothetical protein BC832DRAFT_593082 [Gaertneriomyces semiglobifer]KAJ3185752.1 hypothetical protein HDU85_001111 [Gaertneriomyces sp. JEL0708]
MGGGGHHFNPAKGFQPPKVSGVWFTKLMMAPVWFFCYYRMYHDGPHHFLHKHQWEEPKFIAYLEEVDKKYGTDLSTANMHHH